LLCSSPSPPGIQTGGPLSAASNVTHIAPAIGDRPSARVKYWSPYLHYRQHGARSAHTISAYLGKVHGHYYEQAERAIPLDIIPLVVVEKCCSTVCVRVSQHWALKAPAAARRSGAWPGPAPGLHCWYPEYSGTLYVQR